MYAGTDQGVFKTIDGGMNWTIAITGLTNLNVTALNIEPLTPTTVYAATSGGVFKSLDGGASWTPKNAGLIGTNITTMIRDTLGLTNNWYVATGGSLYVSTNGAESWTLVNNFGNTTLRALAFSLPFSYVGSQAQGVFIRQLSTVFLPLVMR